MLNQQLKFIRFVPAIIIIGVTCLSYYPSLFLGPRADQLIYLKATAGITDLWSLVLRSYAFNRDLGGDLMAFRPILGLLLGFEKWLFEYNFIGWQLTSLILHLAVLSVLFKILAAFSPQKTTLFPLLVTLLFGTQFSSMEMVAWHHIGGYLLFCLLLLLALYNLQKSILNKYRQWVIVVTLLLASFTYELGNIISLLIAGYMLSDNLISKQKKHKSVVIVMLCLIPINYALWSFFDLYHRNLLNQAMAETLINQEKDYIRILSHTFTLPFMWLSTLINPFSVIKFGEGHIVAELILRAGGRIEYQNATSILNFSYVLGFFTVVTTVPYLIFSYIHTTSRDLFKEGILYLSLVFLIILAYSAIITVGRTELRGFIKVFENNSYYSYTSNLLFLILLYKLISLIALVDASLYPGKFFKCLFTAICTVAIFINSVLVYFMSKKTLVYTDNLIQYVKTVKTHSHENDFSFSLSGNCPENSTTPWLGNITTVQAIFPQFYNTQHPKYIIPCGGVIGTPSPTLLLEGYRGFNIISYQNRIYAILQSEGAFDINRINNKGYSRSIVGTSVEEVKQAIDRYEGNSYYPQPVILVENYRGLKIIGAQNRVYAVPPGDGTLNILFAGASIKEVMQQIDNASVKK